MVDGGDVEVGDKKLMCQQWDLEIIFIFIFLQLDFDQGSST
jgi:hypothetical protein